MTYYDVWTSFSPTSGAMRSHRQTGQHSARVIRKPARDRIAVRRYTITTEVQPPKQIHARARVQLEVREGGSRTLLFELSRFLAGGERQARRSAGGVHSQSGGGRDAALAARQRHCGGDSAGTGAGWTEDRSGICVRRRSSGGGRAADCSMWAREARGIRTAGWRWPISTWSSTIHRVGRWWRRESHHRFRPKALLRRPRVSRHRAGFRSGRSRWQDSTWASTRVATTQAGNVTVETYATQGVERDFPNAQVQVIEPDPRVRLRRSAAGDRAEPSFAGAERSARSERRRREPFSITPSALGRIPTAVWR